MEPWLDSLSEDWNSLPRPLTSPQVSQRTPKSAKAVSAGKKASTKIPRLKQVQAAGSTIASPGKITPSSSPLNRKRVLTERSLSDINVSSLSSPALNSFKSLQDSLSPNSSSTVSDASIIKHEPVKHRSRSTSLPKSTNHNTPEWKRHMHNPSSQHDLFSPLALETIFQNPQTTLPKTLQSRIQLPSDMDSMPSSPPPWTSTHRGAGMLLGKQKPRSSTQILDMVNEQDTDHKESPMDPKTRPFPHVSHCQNRNINQLSTGPEPAHQLMDQASESAPAYPDSKSGTKTPGTNFKEAIARLVSSENPKYVGSSLSLEGSSFNSGFSPVYISKHNNVDGLVDYAAVDLSNPEVIKRLQSLSLDGNVDAISKVPQTPDIIPIGEFVSVERGGCSEDGSFRRRALSSSRSSSLVPSDSVSQVTLKTNALLSQFPTPSKMQLSTRRSSSAGPITRHQQKTPPPPTEARVLDIRVQSSGSPLKLFGNHDTFTNNRLLRHMSRLDVTDFDSTCNSTSETGRDQTSHSQKSGSGAGASSLQTAILQMKPESDENSTSPNKRPGSSPIKPPTPKRLRTLTQIENKPGDTSVADFVQDQHHHLQAIIGKKRKDARYDDHQASVDPDEIAKRQILWPRRASLGYKGAATETNNEIELSKSLISVKSELELVQEHIENLPLPPNIANPQQIRAIATELATVRLNRLPHLDGEVRKQSVSTQDYLDEAMKIMDMIRSKAPTGLARVENFDFAAGENGDSNFLASTPLTISRPPSRDGPSVWRTANDFHVDPGIEDHLQKYRETEDESLMIESVTRSSIISESEGTQHEEFQRDPPNVRIIKAHDKIDNAEIVEADAAPVESIDTRSMPRTHSSHPSTDSTGRTICTTSSQRTRTLPVIPPEKVSHLINGEEAGMRFDKEKQTWVKYKVPSPTRGGHLDSSSSLEEEDPFDQIPDLSVNETQERLRVISSGDDSSHTIAPNPDTDIATPNNSGADPHMDERLEENLEQSAVILDPDAQEKQIEITPDDSIEEVAEIFQTTNPLPTSPSDTVRSRKRRDVSVLFSSPVVSHWREAESWNGSVGAEEESISPQPEVLSCPEQTARIHGYGLERLTPNRLISQQDRPQPPQFTNRFDVQSISFMGMEEHQEMSLIETRPDGRTVSLTLSVSTPLPVRRAFSARLRNNFIDSHKISSNSLSPLSDFTVHNDDKRHLESRHLIRTGISSFPNGKTQSTAISVNKLVEKITDAEPTELYWDSLRVLDLKNKDLGTLNLLEDLCPELEHVDLSDNKLTQLVGAPASIRSLRVNLNQLTSLTSWNHLKNLQYVDVSGNNLDNLDAFVDLVHLRELKAEDNMITNLEGVMDLDGLQLLKLKGNQLRDVDFETCMLKSLASLDLSQNNLTHLSGLGWLPELLELDLSQNKLRNSPMAEKGLLPRLKSLNIKSNQLESLDFSPYPNLETLNADNNYLSVMNGLDRLEKLHTLSLRDQRGTIKLSSFSPFLNISHLYLSGNHIPYIYLHEESFLNLQTLELACTGLQAIPIEFSRLCPNIRTLNINGNAVKDLKGVYGIRRLRTLVAAGNRLSKLRRTSKIVSSFDELEILDLRDNPFTVGFHPPTTYGSMVIQRDHQCKDKTWAEEFQHMLPDGNEEATRLYVERLNEETRLRRRVYELLLATGNSQVFKKLDGLEFRKDSILCKDSTWEKLMGLGVFERV